LYERSDADVRKLEGLPNRIGPLRGKLPQKIIIKENDLFFEVDPVDGHKTGFYLDQSVNRTFVQKYAVGKEVLDCFAYTGAFTIHALAGGAESVASLERSENALLVARRNVMFNGENVDKVRFIKADVFTQLRKFRDQGRQFDMIILDPPKFAPTSAHVKKAARAYKDINLLALKLIRPGGLLITFSCSGGIHTALFQKIVADAALDASVKAKIVRHLNQSPDHTVALNFPEAAYLKGLILHVF
jgi:23S rRNA (cytosine1962-C5)-methyltransferase